MNYNQEVGLSKPRTGAPKRVAVGLLAGSLAMFGVAFAPSAGATATVTNERLAGTNRYGTAAAIAGDEAFAAPTHVVIATGQNFPDALAASTLTGANGNAPIILTTTAALSTEASTALDGLRTKNVTTAIIVGGTDAVSTAVQTAVTTKGFTVTRVAGTNRYETAAAIAAAADVRQDSGSVGGQKTALIATGTNFPDALAGGPAAHRNDLPLLLVDSTVPAATRTALTSLGITRAVILGGTAAVSEAVATEIGTIVGTAPTRLAGVNRNSTATAVGDYEITTLTFPATAAILATGLNFPDALAAGPLGGQLGAPIVLTASLPTESRDFLDKHSRTISKLYVAGGTAAIDDATVAAAEAAAETVGNDAAGAAVTTRPELTGAAIVSTTTATQATPANPVGTRVRFTFDETLGSAFGATGTNFFVHSSTNTRTTGSNAAATGATVIETAGNTVLVNFPGIATDAGAAALTKATVAFGAVRDVGGAENPEGAAPIGTAGTTTSTAGTTTAPDLTNVGNFRQSSRVGETAVDFTFDQAAFIATADNFHLVTTANADITCRTQAQGATTPASGGTVVGGNGSVTITAVCTNIGGTLDTVAGTALSTSNVARGYLPAGVVASAAAPGGTANPLQAHDVGTVSTGPDLASVTFIRGALGTATADTVVYTFDDAILQATAVGFQVYTSTAGTVTATAASQTINAADTRQVSVTFPNGTVDTAVGASVTAGAVTNTALVTNQPDEVAAAGTGSTTVAPGSTTGPDLTAVALAASTDAFGNAGAFTAKFTFDEAVTVANQAFFHLYFSNGTRLRANGGCTVGATTATAGEVTCTGFVDQVTGVAPAPASTTGTSVLGTVEFGAVFGSGGAGTDSNPEGAVATTGGTGTKAS